MKYNWSLSDSQFTLLDKLKIAKFILTDDQWTQSKYVQLFEKEMANFVNCSYAVFCSNGSTANTILAMYLKDIEKEKNYVVFPSTTWSTTVSPFIREGFMPKFIDINLNDFSMDLDALESYLHENAHKVALVFITSLIGFTPDIERLMKIQNKYNVRVMMDNCENTFGTYDGVNVSGCFTSTTSTYFGHQLQSVEGGFIFTNNQLAYESFLMLRNHGMIRHLDTYKHNTTYLASERYHNRNVDKRFDFFCLGNNFRNTDIGAYIGLLDFNRRYDYIDIRKTLYNQFASDGQIKKNLILPNDTDKRKHVPFCIPIIFKENNPELCKQIQETCEKNSIETRPIISGNLLRQTFLKGYASPEDFPNSEHLHNNGFYVGLHAKITSSHINFLTQLLK